MLKKAMKKPAKEKEVSVTLIKGEPEEEAEPGSAFKRPSRVEDMEGKGDKGPDIELRIGDEVLTDFEEIAEYVMEMMKSRNNENSEVGREEEE